MTKKPEPTQDKRNIHQRIAAAMATVAYIRKDKPDGLQYSIVSHDAVTAKCRPALLAEGVHYYPQNMVVTQNGNRTEVTLDLKFVNIDNPEDFILVPSVGYGIDQQDKGPGKAVSYAVKYGLLKTLGLETGDDPDLDQTTEFNPMEGMIPADHPAITAEQVAELNALADEVNADKAKFCEYMGVPSIADLTPQAFDVAKAALEKKKAVAA